MCVPSTVVLLGQRLQRSIGVASCGIVLITGLEVTEDNRPRVPLATTFFYPIMDAKATVEGERTAGWEGGRMCGERRHLFVTYCSTASQRTLTRPAFTQ